MNRIKQYYTKNPLTVILAVAFIARLVSVLFARGYGMHDDHFLIIETSRSWASGFDFQGWLGDSPQGHSFTYPLLMYVLFKCLMFLGIENLDVQMYFVRLIHALLSLLTILFSYRIVMRTSNDKRQANITGWILAVLWCMPWLSVRNLVEMVCMPFMVWATWIYVRNENPRTKDLIYSAVLTAVAFAFRFQVIFFIGGMGLSMLIHKQWKNAVVWTVSLLVMFSLTQLSDVFIWHKPFAEMQQYVLYNFFHSGQYPQGGFFKYFGVLAGVLLPPVSIMLLFGFFYNWKKLYLFLPSFCFLLFHSIFPNKQERFIFPIIPFVVMLGVMGCRDFLITHPLNVKWRKAVKVCVVISLVLNFVLLVPVTVHYSKKSRVESMAYMAHYRPNVKSFIYEDTPNEDFERMPRIYTLQNCTQINVMTKDSCQADTNVAFVLFADGVNLNERVANMKKYYPELQYDTVFKPSFIDALMRKINRHNRNYSYFVYRNGEVQPYQPRQNAPKP
ncbi:MAG: glycosyltransferase family 39 protein [Bacteroidales bacterium]|nr:glycosyltransferase family 39 protein [Bacteroidales bacterium]